MKKTLSFFLSAVACTALLMLSCQCSPKDDPVEEPDPKPEVPDDPKPDDPPVEETADLNLVSASVKVTDDWVWEGRPAICFELENKNPVKATVPIFVRFTKDVKGAAGEINQDVEIAANSTQEFIISTEADMDPGFYMAACFVNKKSVKRFYFGISPTKIVSEPDMQPDFNEFWDKAVASLDQIDMNP